MSSAYDASAASLIQSLGQPIQKETATLMNKSLNELAPEYMSNLFTRCPESNGRVLRTTDTDLKLPFLRATILANRSWDTGKFQCRHDVS